MRGNHVIESYFQTPDWETDLMQHDEGRVDHEGCLSVNWSE